MSANGCLHKHFFSFMHVFISTRISQVVKDPPTKALIGSYVGVRNYWKVDKPENFVRFGNNLFISEVTLFRKANTRYN